jgi:hypothetical protein
MLSKDLQQRKLLTRTMESQLQHKGMLNNQEQDGMTDNAAKSSHCS